MKVLVATEKHGTRVFDVSTQDKMNAAYLKLFNERREECYYNDLCDMRSLLYEQACKGDAKAARQVLLMRAHHHAEYEWVEELDAE